LIDSHPSFVRNPFSYFAEFVRGSPTCFRDDLRKCVVCVSPVMVAGEPDRMPAGSHCDSCLKHPSLAACKTSGAHTCIQALRQLRAGFSNERAGRCETVRLCRDLVNPGAFNADVHASSPIIFMILMDLDGVALHHPLRWPRREHMCRFAPLDTRLGGWVLAGALSRVFLVSVPGLLVRRLPLHWFVPHDARQSHLRTSMREAYCVYGAWSAASNGTAYLPVTIYAYVHVKRMFKFQLLTVLLTRCTYKCMDICIGAHTKTNIYTCKSYTYICVYMYAIHI
jgi:hypothetical protein